ncbi:nitroreductase/quinone reductase family protein [Elongatibacter sediminis]|uniref:Nitroreductase/quinone reductase family protein n=1 Tax=Elongatibacter sediminis TaxID=3119006 RepID=A0AAW9RGH8_9GAMM
MKLPESLFAVINPCIIWLLRSPAHGLLSSGVMLITFTGRNSGRTFTTPVRYIRDGGVIRSFTARNNQWWRNMREPVEVTLRIAGKDGRYLMQAVTDDPTRIRAKLLRLLALYPQDAPYYDIELGPDKLPKPGHLDRAVEATAMVEARAV